jgi:predicted dehydrogenase
MRNEKLKLAFIGGGINSAIGMTHQIASTMDNKFTIIAGCFSRDYNINKQTSQKYFINKFYTNYIEMIEDLKEYIDAIVILTPTNKHTHIILDIMKFNIPIICEKTLTNSLDDALKIKSILDKNQGFLITTYNYTGYPMLRELKEMIDNNKLGKVLQINIQMPQESFMRLDNSGNIVQPQEWRLKDENIPNISLDLGTHLSNMIFFLVSKKPLEVIAMENSFGHYNIIDNINCMIRYENNIDCQMWYSKSAIGHKNGFKVEIYGEKASLMWHQMNPEFLEFNDNMGRNIRLDRSSKNIHIANKERYNRFKSGHPAGFIEAFANHYSDIYDGLINYKINNKYQSKYLFNINSSIESLSLMEAIEKSIKTKQWEIINVKNK